MQYILRFGPKASSPLPPPGIRTRVPGDPERQRCGRDGRGPRGYGGDARGPRGYESGPTGKPPTRINERKPGRGRPCACPTLAQRGDLSIRFFHLTAMVPNRLCLGWDSGQYKDTSRTVRLLAIDECGNNMAHYRTTMNGDRPTSIAIVGFGGRGPLGVAPTPNPTGPGSSP